jgi:Ca-activated chloride channel family protein
MNLTTGRVCALAFVGILVSLPPADAQQQAGDIVFRSSVDVVSVTAVVRDRRGHVVPSLTREEFEVVDAGQKRPILDLQSDATAPASIALLVDGSGSMRLGAALESSRIISDTVLASLDPRRDDAALLTFDRRLIVVRDFTNDFDGIRNSLQGVEAWGSTSLYDAIAGTAGIVGERTRNRRAVVVLTDGLDNASEYSPEEVSRIASSIDVPVYVFSLAPTPAERPKRASAAGRVNTLAELARATGGDFFVADSAHHVTVGLKRLLEELRHQYLISFEASAFRGLRRIEIRTRRTELKVRSRGWYSARTGE